MTTSDSEWQRVTTSGKTSGNEWQQVTTSTTTSDNEWQPVTTSTTTSDNEWQPVTTSDNKWYSEWQRVKMSDSKWEQWYSKLKRHSTLQRMDDCHHFNDKKRYTTTLRDGWLQLEQLNKGFLRFHKKAVVLIKVLISSCCQKLSVLCNPWKNGWLQPLR